MSGRRSAPIARALIGASGRGKTSPLALQMMSVATSSPLVTHAVKPTNREVPDAQ